MTSFKQTLNAVQTCSSADKYLITCLPFSFSILYRVSMERRVSRKALRWAQSVKYLVYINTRLMHMNKHRLARICRREPEAQLALINTIAGLPCERNQFGACRGRGCPAPDRWARWARHRRCTRAGATGAWRTRWARARECATLPRRNVSTWAYCFRPIPCRIQFGLGPR